MEMLFNPSLMLEEKPQPIEVSKCKQKSVSLIIGKGVISGVFKLKNFKEIDNLKKH
jgi:hypothetical protein